MVHPRHRGGHLHRARRDGRIRRTASSQDPRLRNGGPIEVKNSSSSFSDGESIVVDDPAVAAQGDGESRRAVKQFHRDETFNMFAVTWEGKRDINSFVRSKQQDGSWSEWLPMDAMNYTEGKNGTELIFVGDTNDVQVSMANVDLVTGSNLDKKEDSLLDKAAKGADANRPAPLAYNVGDISPWPMSAPRLRISTPCLSTATPKKAKPSSPPQKPRACLR